MIRRPPRSTPFPTRRSSDLGRSGTPRYSGGEWLREAAGPGLRPGQRAGESTLKLSRLAKVSSRAGSSGDQDRKSTRLNSSHSQISYAVFCLKKKKKSKQKIP